MFTADQSFFNDIPTTKLTARVEGANAITATCVAFSVNSIMAAYSTGSSFGTATISFCSKAGVRGVFTFGSINIWASFKLMTTWS